jgi:hypothetical protein
MRANPILTWKKKLNDGYGCEYLCLGSIRVASYSHSMSKQDEYDLFIDLPGVKYKHIHNPSVDSLKSQAESIVLRWFEVAQKEPVASR